MSRKSLLGIDLMEWNALSGVSDPYALQLAQISAEAGVPRVAIREDDVSYDQHLGAYLEENGSSLEEFNHLLDHAVKHEDIELQDELLALEAGFMKKTKDLFQKGAENLKARQQKGVAAGYAASQKAKAPAGAPAPTAAPAAAATPPAAEPAAPGAAAGTPPPAPTAGAPVPGKDAPAPGKAAQPAAGTAPAPAVGTTGGNTAQTAPTQPGQTTKAKVPGAPKQKKKTGFGRLAQGAADAFVSGPAQAATSMVGKGKKAFKQVKQGMAAEDIEQWEEFLGEYDLSIDDYMMVVEQAYEFGDDEMIEEVHQLDEIFADWSARRKARAQAKSDEHATKMRGKWKAATDVIAKHGKETVKAASLRGVSPDAPKKKAANEAMDHILSMSGYTDEYISEARSEKSTDRKAKQYQGLTGSNKDDFISKQASRKGGKKLTRLVDDPENKLAPQLVRTLRRTRK